MPALSCPACAKDVALPFPWKFPTYACPHCRHVLVIRRRGALHLRPFQVPISAATAEEMERIVPIVNAVLGIKLDREQFFALAVAALAEKYDTEATNAESRPDGGAAETQTKEQRVTDTTIVQRTLRM